MSVLLERLLNNDNEITRFFNEFYETLECTNCKQKKFIYEFYKNTIRGNLRVRWYCKTCSELKTKEKKKKHGWIPHQYKYLFETEDTKWCTGCKDYLNISLFSKNRSKRKGLHDRCTICKSKSDAASFKRNRKTRILKQKERKHRLRALKRNNKASATWQDWVSILEKYNYTCLSCGKNGDNVEIHQDHAISLKCGGDHIKTNLQPLCKHCNLSKGQKCITFKNRFKDGKLNLTIKPIYHRLCKVKKSRYYNKYKEQYR